MPARRQFIQLAAASALAGSLLRPGRAETTPTEETDMGTDIATLNWEPLFVMDLVVDYAAAQMIGGENRLGIFPVSGGRFEGARLSGTVLPHGADWVTFRQDGSMNIDVRTALETDDGARIAMHYTGIARPTTEAAAERFRNREIGPYDDLYLHTTPRFVTQHPDYDWLNTTIAVTNGQRMPGGARYHVFAIR